MAADVGQDHPRGLDAGLACVRPSEDEVAQLDVRAPQRRRGRPALADRPAEGLFGVVVVFLMNHGCTCVADHATRICRCGRMTFRCTGSTATTSTSWRRSDR